LKIIRAARLMLAKSNSGCAPAAASLLRQL
jgi:hypothetical protein